MKNRPKQLLNKNQKLGRVGDWTILYQQKKKKITGKERTPGGE